MSLFRDISNTQKNLIKILFIASRIFLWHLKKIFLTLSTLKSIVLTLGNCNFEKYSLHIYKKLSQKKNLKI